MEKLFAEQRIKDQFKRLVSGDGNIHSAFLMIHSVQKEVYLDLAEGISDGIPAHPSQPYFTASVGKLFTAVLTAILYEKGLISFDDHINKYLDTDTLYGLHVIDGKDYSGEIKIKHLLGHSSGLPDYLEEGKKKGKSLINNILNEPDKFWTPQEIIEWSKQNTKPHFPPGTGFSYTSMGYHLIGLILEKITSKAFHELLSEYFFVPLEMNHSYLIQYSEPVEKSELPPAGVYVDNKNIISYRSLSEEYTAGGIVSTSADQLKFMKALTEFKLISQGTFEKMRDWRKFSIGIEYGYGIMQFKGVPLLLPAKYSIWGHAGSTGAYMFYHPGTSTYLIGSLNTFMYHRKAIRNLFKVMNELMKVD